MCHVLKWRAMDRLNVHAREYFFIMHLLYAFCAEARSNISQTTVHNIFLFPYRCISFTL
jgi:predicted SprT family Zn-dependent metalloprotease